MIAMRRLALLVGIAVLVAGCSHSGQLVGTWKGKLMPPEEPTGEKDSGDIAKGLGKVVTGFASALVGEMTFEFNKEGKYKASIALGSTTGTYSVSGNTVTLTPDSDKDKKSNISMNMSKWTIDGDKLRSQKDFKSDGEIVLTKTSSTEP